MPAKLQEYKKKRDFKRTAEPKGKVKKGKGDLVFVIQKHDASHLHYDFRLEAGGVLISWAIPKEPLLDPSVKRLAMHVEDHPFDYRNFEGTIPKGNYGGGTVMVWDTGTYHAIDAEDVEGTEKSMAAGMKKGHVTIILNGKKLKGEFTLVKIRGRDEDKDQWLFFKVADKFAGKRILKKDVSVLTGRTMEQIAKGNAQWVSNRKTTNAKPASTEKKVVKNPPPLVVPTPTALTKEDLKGAKKSPVPKSVKPMLARLVDERFDSDEWVFEIKFDGYRAVAEVNKRKVQLYSRNLKSFNTKYPDVVAALEKLPFDAVFDGEVVILDKKGKSDFQLLQKYEEDPQGNLTYMVFDLLWYNGYDLRQLPLLKRKEILKMILPADIDGIKYSDHITGKGKQFYKAAVKAGLEGIMAKRANSVYETSSRSDSWQKIKNIKSQEAIICGYTRPQGGRKYFGSLLLGVHEGRELRYIGNVGTGFSDKTLQELKAKFDKLEQKKNPFKEFPISEKGITWLKPQLVCEVHYSEWTDTGSLRHPAFVGLRTDKPAKTIIEEKAMNADLIKSNEKSKVQLTHLDKVYFPEDGYTKGDVIAFYNEIADHILPYLKDRPESLRRNPNGINESSFFQKDMGGKAPKWIKTKMLHSGSKDEDIEYLFCQDKHTLLYLANLGCIELNPWSSRIPKLDNPDYIVFDLDPNEIAFTEVIKVAKEVKKVLDKLQVPAYIKTSGGRGIHIYVPAGAKYTYEQTQQFAKLIELKVHDTLPDITSLIRMPDQRKGKVYLDFLQNAKGKTMASVYSIRPKKGAPVSTPLKWEELNKKIAPSDFTIKTVPKRLAKLGDLWNGILNESIDLPKVLERFERLYK